MGWWSKEVNITFKPGGGSSHRPLVAWQKPQDDVIKLNFDGSTKENGDSQIGFIFRDSSGCPKYVHYDKINSASAIQAEASALLAGVSMAIHMGIQKIILEGDNLTVINAINGTWKTPWRIKDTIEEIKEMLKKFTFYKTSHCYREGNRAADFLASKCNSNSSFNCTQTLREFHTIIRQDILGYAFCRRIV